MSLRPIGDDDLNAFVDHQLDESRRAEVAAYLARHPDIAARVERDAGQRDALRAALDPVAAEPVPTRLNLAHLARPAANLPARPWRNVAAALSLVLLGGAGGWFLHQPPPAEGIAALAREAAASFAVYAPDRIQPVEMRAENLPALVAWAGAHMPRPPRIPDLAGSGYRLMGGRIVPTDHGAGLMLMYDDDRGTRLVMLARPMAVDQDRRMIPHNDDRVAGWSWATGGMGYSLVGAVEAERLHPLADEIRRQTGKV